MVWEPGVYNSADYFTKHHPGSHHQQVCPIYLYEENTPSTLQGCIKIMDKKKDKIRAVRNYTLPVTKMIASERRASNIKDNKGICSYINLLSKLILNQ